MLLIYPRRKMFFRKPYFPLACPSQQKTDSYEESKISREGKTKPHGVLASIAHLPHDISKYN